jgi:hypothetical protein
MPHLKAGICALCLTGAIALPAQGSQQSSGSAGASAPANKQDQYQLKVQPGLPAEKPLDEGAKPADPATSGDGKAADAKETSLPDFRKGKVNEGPNNQAPYDKLNEYGVLPASSFHDGGTYLPPDQRVPEVFNYLEPRQQIRQGQLLGSQLPPVLLEFRIITKDVKPGDEVRAVARVRAINKARPFTSLFTHTEYGRATAAVYLNFEQSKQDPELFLGRGQAPRYLAAGRYVIADTIISDENGHRKAYWADWNPLLMEADGSPVGFNVPENPDADVAAPTLKRVELLTKSARPGDSIRFKAWVEDDKSGPNEIEAYWISPTERQSIRAAGVRMWNEPGVFIGSFQIPQWYEGGEWRLLSLFLTDNATNERYMFRTTFPQIAEIKVNIEQDPAKVDLDAPQLLAIHLSHDELPREKAVQITALIDDDLSGVNEVYVSFLSPYGADFNRVKLTNDSPNLNRRSQVKQVNVFRGELKIKPTQEPGRWTIARVNISDEANNYRNYNSNRDAIINGMSVFFTDPRMKTKATTEERK